MNTGVQMRLYDNCFDPFGWLSFIEEILSVVYFSDGGRKTNSWKCQVNMRKIFLKLSRYGYGLLLDVANPSSLLYPSCIIQAAAKLQLERLFRAQVVKMNSLTNPEILILK